MRLRRTGFTVAWVCTLVVGCGGSPPQSAGNAASASRPGPDTCKLLTADDIKDVMGVAPGQPRFENNIQCSWPSADGSDEFLVQMIVTGTVIGSYEELAKKYAEDMDTDPAKAMHRLTGVGRFAIGFNEMPMVQVYTSSTMVQVATFGHKEEHALELAKRAVARLP